MTTDVKGVGHLIGDSIDPRKGRWSLRRKLSDERIALLNKPRYIERFEVLTETHCDGTPLVMFQYSRKGPLWTFCAKCKLIIEEPIER